MTTVLISALIVLGSVSAVFVLKKRTIKLGFAGRGLLIGLLYLSAIASMALNAERQAFAGEQSSAIVVQTGVPIEPPDDEGCGD